MLAWCLFPSKLGPLFPGHADLALGTSCWVFLIAVRELLLFPFVQLRVLWSPAHVPHFVALPQWGPICLWAWQLKQCFS
jgi:hypothetical protein